MYPWKSQLHLPSRHEGRNQGVDSHLDVREIDLDKNETEKRCSYNQEAQGLELGFLYDVTLQIISSGLPLEDRCNRGR